MKKTYVLVMTLLLFSFTAVFSQGIDVSGTVTAGDTGDPLPGANIAVKGTNLGTASNVDGQFNLKLPDARQATLVISFIGYKTEEVKVTSESDVLNVTLPEDVLKVSEIVVTGLATSVKKRNLANSVGTVSQKELLPAPAQTLERALNGKMAGINVSQNTGAPGGGINVNLRGVSTITGNTQPLYIVDGVILSDDAIQSGIDVVSEATVAGSARPQGQPTNRIADINPNDIENIEVLKGASASAIYGSKATNGVVIITTKSGAVGRTRVDVSQQFGFSSILHKIGIRRFTRESAIAQYADPDDPADQQRIGALYDQTGGRFIDQEDVLFGQRGFVTETSIGVRGGSQATQFYVSGYAQNEDGIVKNTGYQKFSGRANVTHKISDRIRVNANLNFARTQSDRSITGNDNTNTTLGFSLGFTPSFVDLEPKNGVYPVNPFNPSNPVETRDLLQNRETVFRTIGAARLDWNIAKSQSQSLDFNLQGGADYFSMENFIYAPNELQFERSKDLPGESVNGTTGSIYSNLYLNLVHTLTTSGNIMFRTTGGVQFENRNINNVLVNSNGLIQTQSSVDQAAKVEVFQEKVIQRERGFFIQEEADLNERIYLTAGLRGDASSANGDNSKYFLFPKFSGSLRLSEYGFWSGLSGLSSEFKIRAAYGETGNLPQAGAKFTNLLTENIGGITGLRPATTRGDEDIRPERTKEIELGFDATILKGNGTIEFSYYRQNISDLILEADLPPSSGFTEIQTNAGKMRTTGWEVSLGLTPIRSQSFNWTSRLNFFSTDSKITQLDVDPFNLGGFATFLGTMRIQEGFSPTTIVGGESFDSEGNLVKPLGNQTPDFTLSLNNNFTFGNFELSFLWDWQQGGDVINLGKLIMDLGGTSPDYEEIGTFQLPDGSTVTGQKGLERINLLGTLTAPYVEDGTFLKLRELSLSYSLPSSVVRNLFAGQLSYFRVGVAGRNLLMMTGYDGFDPEVSQFGNVAIGRAVDTLPFPSSRQVYFNITFGL